MKPPKLKPFIGAWVLDPAQSQFGDQPVPESGLDTIVNEGEKLGFHLDWRFSGQDPVRAVLWVIPDGQPRAVDADRTLVCAIPAPNVMVIALSEGTEILHTVRREVAGRTMTVTQQQGATQTVACYQRSPIKQVIAYRRDLKMRKGKIAAQVAHASMRVFFKRGTASSHRMEIPLTPAMALWVQGSFTKVVLSVGSEADLLKIHETARARGLPTALITDSGRTEFGGVPTRTTVAVGPASAHEIDPITGRDWVVLTKLA